MNWLRQNWLRYLSGSAAFPIFIVLALLIPNVDAEDKAIYPIFALDDLRADQSIDQVVLRPDADWRIFNARGLPSLAIDPVELWYRVKIPPHQNQNPKRLVAELGYYLVPKVDFFLVENQKVIRHLASGMDVPRSSSDKTELFYTFPIQSAELSERVLYVRVTRGTTLMAPLIVREEARFYRINLVRDIFHGVVLGAFFGVFLYNVVLYTTMRKRTYLYFALYLAATLVYALLESGFPAFLSTTIAHQFNLVARVMSEIALACFWTPIIFGREFLRLGKNLPLISIHMRIFELIIICAAMVIPFVSIPVAFFIAVVIMFANFFYMAIAALVHLHLREVYQFFAAFVGVFAGRVIWYANEFGIVDGSPFLGCFYQLGCVWAAVIMTSAIASRIDGMKQEHEKIENILQNNGPRNVLNSVLENSFSEQYTASDMTVTIMFIDIASFSRLAEITPAEIVFVELSRRIQEITNIVQEFGGTIDRSLGDGVLCFFGYENSKESNKHAINAFKAAKKIQTANAQALADDDAVVLPLPVRIGIHSDRVTIGNMGTAHQVDFTMVGNGVNFANRLEASCSLFRIMVSEASYRLLVEGGELADDFAPIMIAVKHQVELVKAYEYDPFRADPSTLNRAIRRHLDQLGLAKRGVRYSMDPLKPVYLKSKYGRFTIVDFSASGFQLRGDGYLAQRALIEVELDFEDSQLNQSLAEKFVHIFLVEVRWSRRSQQGYEHGVSVYGGSERQWKLIYQHLVPRKVESSEQFVSKASSS